MDKKQTSLLTLTVLAFGFLGYQVYQLIGSDLSQTQPGSPATKLMLKAPPQTVPLGGGSSIHATISAPATPTQISSPSSAAISTPTLATLPHPHLLKSQQEYLELLNQYELLKMRRQMLEEQAAIAQAQNRIAVLNDQTRKLDATVNTDVQGNYETNGSNNSGYQLSYIDQQNGQWTASIYHNGAYQVVNKGSLLADGAIVKDISQQGVIIQNKTDRKLISFNGLIELPSAATPPTKPTVGTIPVPSATKAPEVQVFNWKATNIFSLDPTDNSVPALDEHKVLSIPKGHYTIQLMGSYNKDMVDGFIKNNDLQGKVFLYSVPSRDKYWYIVIFGDYADLADAKKALLSLSPEVRARGSWIRQYGEIQNMMRG